MTILHRKPKAAGDVGTPDGPTLRQDVRRRMKGTSGRGRKLGGLVRLLRPYRGRVILMFVARTMSQ